MNLCEAIDLVNALERFAHGHAVTGPSNQDLRAAADFLLQHADSTAARQFMPDGNPFANNLIINSELVARFRKLCDHVAAQAERHPERFREPATKMPSPWGASDYGDKMFARHLENFAPTTWMLWSLVAINLGVWLITGALGASHDRAAEDQLIAWGGNLASEVQRGEWWRLVSSIFLHSGHNHLIGNLAVLIAAGETVERVYSHRGLLLIYLGAGLIGSAASLLFAAQQVVSIGSSGAVFGVVGALLAGVIQHRDRLPTSFGLGIAVQFGIVIAISLVIGLTRPGIDNAAHIGGLLSGLAMGIILPERFDQKHFDRTIRRRMRIAVACIAVLTGVLVAFAPAAPTDQRQSIEGQVALRRNLTAYEESMRSLDAYLIAHRSTDASNREVIEKRRQAMHASFLSLQSNLLKVYLRPADPMQHLLVQLRRGCALAIQLLEWPIMADAPLRDWQKFESTKTELSALSEEVRFMLERR